jgi:hypothetical protein
MQSPSMNLDEGPIVQITEAEVGQYLAPRTRRLLASTDARYGCHSSLAFSLTQRVAVHRIARPGGAIARVCVKGDRQVGAIT